MNEEQQKSAKSVKSVAEGWQELQRLTDSEGNYAYRGQENADWGVESGAFRRLNDKTNPQVKKLNLSKEDFIDYHEKELLEQARMDGYGVEDGRDLSDLELLAKLQHRGAATCLIDFTRNFLVAMWFACQPHKEKEEGKDGKIFILNTSDEENFRSLEGEDLEKKVRPLLTFQTRDGTTSQASWWYWSPYGLDQRIIKQDSLFIFGQQKIENALLQEIEISNKHKNEILKEIERSVDITERALFKDLPGFAESHGPDKPLPPRYGEAESYFQKGNEALQRDDIEGAMAYYNEAIKLNSDYAEAYNNRGTVKSNSGDHPSAEADYDRAIELKPDFAEAYNNRGTAKSNQGNHRGAIADYSRAIELKPDYAEAPNNQGATKSNLGDHRGAKADYARAIKHRRDYAEAYHNRGLAKSVLGDYDGAIADYARAIRHKRGYAEAYNNRGKAKSDLGDYRGAIADYARAIRYKRGYAEAYNNRGLAKADLDEHSEAIADYDRAIELKPDFAGAYYNRGNAKADSDEYSEAIADYDRAIELKPDFAKAYNNRGDVNQILKRHSEAMADFDRAIELNPNYVKAYYNRGQAYASLKEKEKARQDFSKAWKLVEQSGKDLLLNLTGGASSELDNGWGSIEAIWERNKDLSAAEAQALVDKAVAEVRANRS